MYVLGVPGGERSTDTDRKDYFSELEYIEQYESIVKGEDYFDGESFEDQRAVYETFVAAARRAADEARDKSGSLLMPYIAAATGIVLLVILVLGVFLKRSGKTFSVFAGRAREAPAAVAERERSEPQAQHVEAQPRDAERHEPRMKHSVDDTISNKEITVFVSYAHEDEALKENLSKHLAILKHKNAIALWNDREITAGTNWKDQIDSNLELADIILLLVSSDFLASQYCYDIEMQRAIQRHDAGEARVIPIILRSVEWHDAPFGKLQALPKNAKPVAEWPTLDAAFADVARGIRKAVQELSA